HPEDQRKAGGEHGVEAADEHALDDDVDPFHRGYFLNGERSARDGLGLLPLPPELGLARVRHFDWPKSSRLDFGWGGGRGEGVRIYRWTLTPHPNPLPTGEGADRVRCPAKGQHFITFLTITPRNRPPRLPRASASRRHRRARRGPPVGNRRG